MNSRFTTFLVLAAIMLQGVFGSLQDSVVICLGGGHQHDPVEVVEECAFGCSHESEWPTPASDTDHIGNCDCTDIELGLVALLTTPRTMSHDLKVALLANDVIVTTWTAPKAALLRGPPPYIKDDPGNAHRLALIRSTRLIV